MRHLGAIVLEKGRTDEALHIYGEAVAAEPRAAQAHASLGNALRAAGRSEEAAASYRRAIALQADLAYAHANLGSVLFDQADFAAAEDSCRRALELDPGLDRSYGTLGAILQVLGRFDDAADCFRRALARRPESGHAYFGLVSGGETAIEEAELRRLAELAANVELTADDRAAAGFALGNALDAAGRYDEAFGHYAEANTTYRQARNRAGAHFDAESLHSSVDLTIQTYTPEFFRSVGRSGNPSEVPVFIVGMPRSGTTLVEQIAASHSQVFGAGELPDIDRIAATLGSPTQNGAGRWEPAEIRRTADAHLDHLLGLGGGAKRVIDKMPDNIFQLGVIATVFPGARIIFCRRDPRDICLSCFFQMFAAGNLWAFDLADSAKRYLETERLAAHWQRVLPLRMLDLSYEALVADLEGEARRLIAFLGLDWEPACLDFHRVERAVRTASVWQVRQPLYSRSAGRWRHYEKHLGPIREELSAGSD